MKECVICGELFEPIRKTQICCCKVCAEDRRILICRWNRKVRQAQVKRAKAEKAKEKPVIDEMEQLKNAEYFTKRPRVPVV